MFNKNILKVNVLQFLLFESKMQKNKSFQKPYKQAK